MTMSIKRLLSFDTSVDARHFLGALAKLRKATFISSYLSIRIENFGSRWTDFSAVLYRCFLQEGVKNFKFGINRIKNSDTFCEDVRTFMTAVVNKVTMAAVDSNRKYSAFFLGTIYMVHN
jgi:hypothetical protein